jgi:hypothetical protein
VRLGFVVDSDGVAEEVTTDRIVEAANAIYALWHEVEDILMMAFLNASEALREWASREQAGGL